MEKDAPVVFLGAKGEIRQGKLKGLSSPASFANALKKKEAPSVLGTYLWKQKVVTLLGYLEGKPNTENQHHLPPPLEGITYYGDILVILTSQANNYSKLIPLKTADYEAFYTAKLEGEDDEEEEELADEEDLGILAEKEDSDEDIEYGEAPDEEEKEVEAEAEVESEEEIIEKPVRVPKTRKQAAPVVEDPEVLESEEADQVPIRINIINVISNTFPKEFPTEDAILLESILYNTALDAAVKKEIRKTWSNPLFSDIYLANARRVLANLNPLSYVKNKGLWERYINKELTLEQIVYHNYYELCPEHWQGLIDQQAKRERTQLEGDFSRATDRWQCNGCKMRKTTYYELQTRCSDEPMTIFIHCLNCGKRWTH